MQICNAPVSKVESEVQMHAAVGGAGGSEFRELV